MSKSTLGESEGCGARERPPGLRERRAQGGLGQSGKPAGGGGHVLGSLERLLAAAAVSSNLQTLCTQVPRAAPLCPELKPGASLCSVSLLSF